MGIVGDALVCADQTIRNIEDGKCCEMLEQCRKFLTPSDFIECANGENPCSKSEIVTKRMLAEILTRLDGLT